MREAISQVKSTAPDPAPVATDVAIGVKCEADCTYEWQSVKLNARNMRVGQRDWSLTGDYARHPRRCANEELPLLAYIGNCVLSDNGQKNDDGDNEDIEVDVLGIRLAKPATNEARRTRVSQRTRRMAVCDEDGARDRVSETVYHICERF